MTAGQIARRAIVLLHRSEFCQHQLQITDRASVSYCLLGAVYAVDGYRFGKHEGPWKTSLAADALITKVGELLATKHVHVWNDHPARTKAEVIDVLDRAAQCFEAA